LHVGNGRFQPFEDGGILRLFTIHERTSNAGFQTNMFLVDGVGSEGNSLNSRTIKKATVSIRLSDKRDVGEQRRLIEASVLGLQAGDYSPAQLKRALQAVYGVDTQLIADGSYFVAEVEGDRAIGSSGH
jgi:hypothetical protein